MLDIIKKEQKLSKETYKEKKTQLEIKLSQLQQKAKAAGLPVIIVFEGWDAAGKGTQIGKLLLSLDPRGYQVHPINPPTEEERFRPSLWRFWNKIPPRGKIAIFDGSWYEQVTIERIQKTVREKDESKAFDSIQAFESQLTQDGYLIIKFFLHISKEEQKSRFQKLEKNAATAWKVTGADWKNYKRYKKLYPQYEKVLKKTDYTFAPWHVLSAENERIATIEIYEKTCLALEKALSQQIPRKAPALKEIKQYPLRKINLELSIPEKEYETRLRLSQKRLYELEHELYHFRIPLILVFEGSDAAGKGGVIKRLVRGLDPRGFEVVPIGAPSEEEKRCHYLKRFWEKVPKAGHITIFDRSWYGRVLVERVEELCPERDWKRAYEEILDTEKQWAQSGAVILKFWLQIDPATQLKRFELREGNPLKKWKITEEDWRNREKWDAYQLAVNEMLYRTHKSYAKWHIIEANDKKYARIKVLETCIDTLEKIIERAKDE